MFLSILPNNTNININFYLKRKFTPLYMYANPFMHQVSCEADNGSGLCIRTYIRICILIGIIFFK